MVQYKTEALILCHVVCIMSYAVPIAALVLEKASGDMDDDEAGPQTTAGNGITSHGSGSSGKWQW